MLILLLLSGFPLLSQTLLLENGANLKILNNGLLDLGNTTTLQESGGKITDGSVKATRPMVNAPSSLNFAGLGAILSTTQNLGETMIIRTHDIETVNGDMSINRYYDIMPSHNSGLNATLGFRYFDSELNGLTESDLTLFRSDDGGLTYVLAGHSSLDAVTNTITQDNIDAFSRWTAASRSVAQINPPNCRTLLYPSTDLYGVLNVRLEEAVPNAVPLPIYDVQVYNEWGGLIWSGQNLDNTDFILENMDLCDFQGQSMNIRISNEMGTCESKLLIPSESGIRLTSAFGPTTTLDSLGLPTGRMTDGKLVTYCGFIPDANLHRPAVSVSCGGRYKGLAAQPDWIDVYPCNVDSDTSEVIYRTWEVFNKEGELFMLTDTIVVLRLPALNASNFVGYSEDSGYCAIEPVNNPTKILKQYAAWKQPMGLHDYELPHTRLRGVTYELPLTVVLSGLETAQAQTANVMNEYLNSVIVLKTGGREVTIGDIVSGHYMDDLIANARTEQLAYGFLHAIYKLGQDPISILGGKFSFFPYLLLEEGDRVLSESGQYEKVTSDWFYTGHGNAPFWFSGGWPLISGDGDCVWYSDGDGNRRTRNCGIQILLPGLESDTADCVVLCLDDIIDNPHCGIHINYQEDLSEWSGHCPQARGRDIIVKQTCWGQTENECVSDEYQVTNGGDGFVVVNEKISHKIRSFHLSQWQTLIDTIGPIFDFCYPLTNCGVTGMTGETGPSDPPDGNGDNNDPGITVFSLNRSSPDDSDSCARLPWCAEDIMATIRAGKQYSSAKAWERCHPTVYRVNANDCKAEVFVPDVQLIDNCSGLHSIKAIVEIAGGERMVALDQTDLEYRIKEGGDTSFVYTYSHTSDPITIPFNGCDGELIAVRYEAADNCWNQSEWVKYIQIIDDTPPTVVVNRDVNLSLKSEIDWVYAEQTFDEGSWDNCAIELMLVRRSDFINFITICDKNTKSYDSWVDILSDLGIDRNHASMAARGVLVGTEEVNGAFSIKNLANFLKEGEIKPYYLNQIAWLWEDGQNCGRKVVHGWIFELASYIAGNCSAVDDHGNRLDVRDLEYIFDNLFLQPGYGREIALLGGGWAQAAPFTCKDACEVISVELLVVDACCNWNTGLSDVHVEDKSTARLVNRLPDLEISCESYNIYYKDIFEAAGDLGEHGSIRDSSGIFGMLDSVFGRYDFVYTYPPAPFGGLSAPQTSSFSDPSGTSTFRYFNLICSEKYETVLLSDTAHDKTVNQVTQIKKTTVLDTVMQTSANGIVNAICSGNIVQDVWIDLNDCENGTITRRFFISSGCTSMTTPLELLQVIHIRSACTLDESMFDLPKDLGSMQSPVCLPQSLSNSYFPESLGNTSVKSHLKSVLCNEISAGKEVNEFNVPGQKGLKKFQVTWTMKDWCSGLHTTSGEITYTQDVIAVIDPGCKVNIDEINGSGIVQNYKAGEQIRRDGFKLYQNRPNPFEGYTVIGFELPEATIGRLTIYDVTGKVLLEIKGDYVRGYNEIMIIPEQLQATGVLFYQLDTERYTATKKMVKTRTN